MWIGFGLCLRIARVCVKDFFSIFCGNADPGEEQDPGSDGFLVEGVQQGPVLVRTFFMVAEEYLPPTAAPGTWVS